MTIDEFRRDEEWIRFFLDRIYRIDGPGKMSFYH